MKRHFLNLLTAASFLLCVTALAFGSTSYWFVHNAGFTNSSRTAFVLNCFKGRVWINIQYSAYYHDEPRVYATSRRVDRVALPEDTFWERRGFWGSRDSLDGLRGLPVPATIDGPWWFDLLGMTRKKPVSYLSVAVPVWLLVLLTGLLPAWRLRHILRSRQRRLRGHCSTCGYDLRASPERCPECGALAESAAVVA